MFSNLRASPTNHSHVCLFCLCPLSCNGPRYRRAISRLSHTCEDSLRVSISPFCGCLTRCRRQVWLWVVVCAVSPSQNLLHKRQLGLRAGRLSGPCGPGSMRLVVDTRRIRCKLKVKVEGGKGSLSAGSGGARILVTRSWSPEDYSTQPALVVDHFSVCTQNEWGVLSCLLHGVRGQDKNKITSSGSAES